MQKAFTLVELIVVIAIIAILAAGLLVGLNPMEMIARSKDATVNALTAEVGKASERWLISINGDVNTFYSKIPSSSACTPDHCIVGQFGSIPGMPEGYTALINTLNTNGELKESTKKKLLAPDNDQLQPVIYFSIEDGLVKFGNACYRPRSQQELSKAIYNASGDHTPVGGGVTCGVKTTTGYPVGANGDDMCHICLYDHRP